MIEDYINLKEELNYNFDEIKNFVMNDYMIIYYTPYTKTDGQFWEFDKLFDKSY